MTRRAAPTLRPLLSLFAALAATLFGLAPAVAQDKPVVLKLTSNSPAKSPWATQIERIVKLTTEESKGSIKLEAYLGGQLGNEQDTVQQVARGRIEMGFFAMGAVSLIVPELVAVSLPTYFRSSAELDCVLDKHLFKPYDELLAAKGVKLLGFGEVGQIDLVGKKPYVNPTDVRGIKAVTYSKAQAIMWNALGTNSTFVGVPEWTSALQTGVVDIVGAPMALYVPSGLNKVAPVLSRVNLWDSAALLLMNKAAYDKLSAEQKAVLERVLKVESAALLRAEIRGFDAKLREMHLASGGQVVDATAEQREAWRKALAPAWPEMIKAMGGDSDKLFKLVEAAHDSCKGG